jgi:hypothetical protein
VYGEGKKYFCTGPTKAIRQNKNIFYWIEKPDKSTKEGPLSIVLFESPFASALKAEAIPL